MTQNSQKSPKNKANIANLSNSEPPLVFLRPRSGVTITASKKVFKTAIARNKARRLAKEAHRTAEKEIYGSNKGYIPVPISMNLKISVLTTHFQNLIQLIKKEIQKHV